MSDLDIRLIYLYFTGFNAIKIILFKDIYPYANSTYMIQLV